eukprot:scaffold268311_cov40-Tisochrysis_lutea.AAC.6
MRVRERGRMQGWTKGERSSGGHTPPLLFAAAAAGVGRSMQDSRRIAKHAREAGPPSPCSIRRIRTRRSRSTEAPQQTA